MMPGVDAKKLEQMMKKLNMDMRQLEAEEVVIKMKDREIVISGPEIMITNMMGREVYQITGAISERKGVSSEDVKMVMQQTGADEEVVAKKLKELNNDLARAISELKR